MTLTWTTLLKHRSVQVLLAVTLYLTMASSLPIEVHQGFYTLSLFMKDLLLWMLPITVSLFIAQAIASFERRAPLFILTLFVFEALSNGASVWYAFGSGHLLGSFLHPLQPASLIDTFQPLWRLAWTRPTWWSADKGTFAGLAVGLIAAFAFPALREGIQTGKRLAEQLLTRTFARLIPLFVLGFVARMYNTGVLGQIWAGYADVLAFLVLLIAVYVSALFFIGSGLSFRRGRENLRNLLPAASIAFSSGCSLSTMPWTIEGTAKNLQDPDLAKAVIPATTNIQQIGDCIANAFLCFVIYLHFNGAPPSLATWISFSFLFVLARFATAAVIGGAIFVMLPIYEHSLHFTPEMIAIILAFNVILDPLITCSNVVANGALCRIFERVWSKVKQPLQTAKS